MCACVCTCFSHTNALPGFTFTFRVAQILETSPPGPGLCLGPIVWELPERTGCGASVPQAEPSLPGTEFLRGR